MATKKLECLLASIGDFLAPQIDKIVCLVTAGRMNGWMDRRWASTESHWARGGWMLVLHTRARSGRRFVLEPIIYVCVCACVWRWICGEEWECFGRIKDPVHILKTVAFHFHGLIVPSNRNELNKRWIEQEISAKWFSKRVQKQEQNSNIRMVAVQSPNSMLNIVSIV